MNLKHLLTKLNPFGKKEIEEIKPIEPILEEAPNKKPEPLPTSMKDAPFIKHNYKVPEEIKQILVAHLASGITPTEIVEIAKNEHNIDINAWTISQYSRSEKWQPLMRKIRESRMNDLASVSGSHKRVRLERHEKVYEKALKKGDLRNSLAATEAQRKEMEGDTANITLNQQFNILTDEELDHKKKIVMERIKLMTSKGELT